MLRTGSRMMQRWVLVLAWMICGFTTESTVGANAAYNGNRTTCMETEYDISNAEDRLHPGAGLRCCGKQAFNPAAATCCTVRHGDTVTANVTEGLSHRVSSCCGLKAYNSLNELCCQTNVIAKPAPKAQCCGKEAFNDEEQLCCGPIGNKTILTRQSCHHLCCGHDQFNNQTQWCSEDLEIHLLNASSCEKQADNRLCCGPIGNKRILTRQSSHHLCCGHDQFNTQTQCCSKDLEIHLLNSSSCEKQAGAQPQKPGPQPTCTEPQSSLCGSSCYNPNESRCCERDLTRLAPGGRDAAPTVYKPHTHICCAGHVSLIDQLQFHGSPGKHCCGTEVYRPRIEICCDGQRHPIAGNMQCCGAQNYSIESQQMKCCAGTLYNLTLLRMLGHEARCCGSILQKPQDVCCSGEDQEVLYSAKAEFRCCGHLYYNTSLWSCYARKLSPAHQPGRCQNKMVIEPRLQSVNNLKETVLCEEMLMGTVDSVSQHDIVFSPVLKIRGRNGTVNPVPSPYILKTPERCNSPSLTPGRTYFFDEVNVFTDLSHDSILQSLFLIFTKCHRH